MGKILQWAVSGVLMVVLLEIGVESLSVVNQSCSGRRNCGNNPCTPTTCRPVPTPCPRPQCSPCPAPSTCRQHSTICPYKGVSLTRYGRKRCSTSQRRCYVDGHCPSDSTCCKDNCQNGKVCRRKASTAVVQPERVKVTVIFTYGCSDALAFLAKKIVPFSQYVNAELVAYGSVTSGECQFGYRDCRGNRMIACAARYLPDQEAVLAFTICIMKHQENITKGYYDIDPIVSECGRGYEDNIESLYTCGDRSEGYNLFREAGLRQQQLIQNLQQVPTVALNEHVIITHESQLEYFFRFICEYLKQDQEAMKKCIEYLYY